MPAKTQLREVLIVEQTNPSLRRCWFESDYFDLFTWQDLRGAFTKFQLCYDADLAERVLVWDRKEGFSHDEVDHRGRLNSPILVADGRFDSGTVAPRFEREAAEIPADVRGFVLAKIREFLIESHRKKTRRRVRRARQSSRKN